jgi:elongation factor P
MAKSKTKSVSVKKSLKTNKKKKFSLKNLDFKKNWKKLSYLGLAGFLTIASLGYGVWKNATEGNSGGNITKPVTTETGLVVSAPMFIKEGDVIRVDTRDGEYVERASQ